MAERAVQKGPRCWALILAGGAGVRLRMNQPKAFVSLRGRPLLAWSLEHFALHPQVTDVLTVVPAGWEVAFRDEILSPWSARADAGEHARVHAAIAGGAQRQDSARMGLETIRARTPDSEVAETIVLIHDAARPMVPPRIVDLLIESLQRKGPCAGRPRAEGPVAVVPVVPVEDTLKAVTWSAGEAFADSGIVAADCARGVVDILGGLAHCCGVVSRTVPRKGLCRAQTPQAFFLGPILEAHLGVSQTHSTATDDSTLYELNGWPVEAVPGSRLNVKVAQREDLQLLEAWLATGEQQ